MTRTAIRCVGAAQAAVGLAMVLRPSIGNAGGGGHVPAWIVRLLGVRMAAQGVAELSSPTPLVAGAGAAVDGLHAASMVGLAAVSRRYRRAALRSAAAAAGSSAALAALTRGSEPAQGSVPGY